MRRSLLLTGACLLAAPAALAQAAAGAPPEATADVVALGDSYASGEGSADFSTIAAATDCHRSPNSASALAVAEVDSGWVRVDATCSGALTADLLAPQSVPDAPGGTVPPQLDALAALDPTGARFVTLSIGGNDAGFASVLASCVLAGFLGGGSSGEAEQGCEDRNPEVEPFLSDGFPSVLSATYRAVLERLAAVTAGWPTEAAARPVVVFVTDYPLIFPADAAQSCEQIAPEDLEWLNSLWRAANEVIATEVAAADAAAATRDLPVPVRFQLVPLGDVLDGHRLCEAPPAEPATQGDATSEWVHGLELASLLGSESRSYAFHPNAAGQQAMAARLAAALRNPPTAEGAPAPAPVPPDGGSGSTVAIVVALSALAIVAAGGAALWWRRRPRS